MKYDYFIIVLFLGACQLMMAQQDVRYALYRYHMNMINPAVNGLQGGPNINFGMRSQWAGIKDAPETQTLSFATPTNHENIFLGFNIVNDNTFVETQTQFFASFSFHLPLSNYTQLYLGIQAGANAYRVNAYDLKVYGITERDPNLMDFSRFNPNIGAGLYLDHERFYFSLSTPRMLNTERFKDEAGLITTASDKMHIYTSLGFRLPLNRQWTLVPSGIAHSVANAPTLWALNLTFDLNNSSDFGIEYTPNAGFGAMFMLGRDRFISVGYAYTHTQHSQLQQLSRGTHEALLRIRLSPSKQRQESITYGSGGSVGKGRSGGKQKNRQERRTGTKNKGKN